MSAFNQLKAKLAAQGASNPGGLAASIGRKKYGATFNEAAAKKESVQAVLRQRRKK